MLPTHVLVGAAVAAPVLWLAPDLAPAALAGGLVGGTLPDLDLYTAHRRHLHYPTGYAVAAVPAAVTAALLRTPWLVALAFVLFAAAVHCRMDRYGGGLELRPWEGTSERAVYDHVRGHWRVPKRWVRYDGAPEDLLLAVVVGTPLLVVLEGPFRTVVGAALAVALTYGLLRRHLAELAPTVFGYVPEPLEAYVPERYEE